MRIFKGRMAAAALLALAAIAATGCGKGSETAEDGRNVEALAATIKKEYALEGMKEERDLSLLFGDELDGEKEGVISYALWMPEKNILADRLLIAEAADDEAADKIEEALREDAKATADVFASYAPEAYALAKNAIIERDGDFILYVMDEDADGIADTFHRALR